MAFEPWSGSRGYLFAFRQGGDQSTQAIALQGLDRARTYRLVNVRTGALVSHFSGAALRAGFELTLPARYSAQVISIDPL